MADAKRVIEIVVKAEKALRDLDSIEKASQRTAKASEGILSVFNRLQKLTAVSAGFYVVSKALSAVNASFEAFAKSTDSIKLLSLQAEGLGGTFEKVYTMAQRLGITLDDTSVIINKMVPALRDTGYSFDQSTQFVDNLVRSMRLFGVDGARANSVILQLGQALNSNQLAGEELKALRENAGGLLQPFTEAIKQITGSTLSLKELGSQGVLTADVVTKAWEMTFKNLGGRMGELPVTMEQVNARLSNAWTKFLATLDDALKISEIYKFFKESVAGFFEKVVETYNEINKVQTGSSGRLWVEMAQTRANIARLEKEGGYVDEFGQEHENAALIQQRKHLAELEAQYKTLMATKKDLTAVEGELASSLGKTNAVLDISVASLKERLGLNETQTQFLARNWDTITKAAEQYGHAVEDILAIMQQESSFGMARKSPTGVLGVMQMTRDAAREVYDLTGLTVDQIRKTEYGSIIGGSAYLALLKSRHGGGLQKAYKHYGDANFLGYSAEVMEKRGRIQGVLDPQARLKEQETYYEGIRKQEELLATAAQKAADEKEKARLQDEASIRKLQEQYEPLIALENEYKDAIAEVNRLEGQLGAAQAASMRSAITKEYEKQRMELEKLTTGYDAFGEKILTVNELIYEGAKSLASGIQSTLGDAFYQLFNGTLKSAADFLKSLKDLILREIANIAAKLLTQRIIVPIMGALLGTEGGLAVAGGGGAGSAASTSSYSGLLGGIGKLFSSNSMGSTISGWIAEGVQAAGLASEATLAGLTNLAGTSNMMLGAGALVGTVAGSALFGGKGYADIGSSIGSAAGAVIGSMILPGIGTIIGGALGGVAGGFLGSLFGGGEKKATANLAVSGGRITVSGGKGWDEGVQSQVLGQIDQINQVIARIRETLPEEIKKTLDAISFSAGTITPENASSLLESTFTRIFEALGQNTGGAFKLAADAAGGDIEKMVALFQQVAAAMEQLNKILKANPAEDYAEALAKAEKGITGQIEEINKDLDSITELNSYADFEKLTNSMVARYNLELALIAQISEITKEIKSNLDEARQEIELTGASDQQVYDYYRKQADDLLSQLEKAKTPEEIQRLSQEAIQAIMRAWGALPADQQAGAQQEFLALLDYIETLTNERLAKIKEDSATDFENRKAQLEALLAANQQREEMKQQAILSNQKLDLMTEMWDRWMNGRGGGANQNAQQENSRYNWMQGVGYNQTNYGNYQWSS